MPSAAAPPLKLPSAPVLAASPVEAVWLSEDGELETVRLLDRRAPQDLAKKIRGQMPILCHGPSVARRIRVDPFPALDLLELFAFVYPARFCIPTAAGMAQELGLPPPATVEEAPAVLFRCMTRMLSDLKGRANGPDVPRIAMAMARAGWSWGPSVLAALGQEQDDGLRAPTSGLDVWKRLPEWREQAPPPPPGDRPVQPDEARFRLATLLGEGAEERRAQSDYASAVCHAFAPRDHEGAPNFVMAEAGTGVGKTLGYIAPASIWAEKNEAPIWLSTYTRNLQQQIDEELSRLVPDPRLKAERVVIRKGRENYICLLNYEEATRTVAVNRAGAIPLGLIARWISATRGGDMTGGDFPSWLSDILGMRATLGLTDRRGECIYSACSHFSRCFIEHGIRRARRADLVVANHALVMVQAARGGVDPAGRVNRFVFDEGHHVFDAADSAFSAHLSGLETAELRRWLRGAEAQGRGRARGLKARIEDLATEGAAREALEDILAGAASLPSEGWRQRTTEGRPAGPAEALLSRIRQQVYARARGADGPYDLEVDTVEPVPGLLEAAGDLHEALSRILLPAKRLAKTLTARMDEEAEELDTASRARIEAAVRSLEHRCIATVQAWMDMLAALGEGTPDAFVDWFAVSRMDGRDVDVGMYRHWVDPMIPFSDIVAKPAHGVLITSATLTDGSGDVDADWHSAEARTGAVHLDYPALRVRVSSPFDYPNQTRVLIVTDVRKDSLEQVAAAYRELFRASGGGALGLFTAISRLRAVYDRIVQPLEEDGLPLYAQHIDNLNLTSLTEIFRSEEDSSLLGTDAMRDGVDVPGRSLRLLVFDRVPWPRPTILHKARRAMFGAKNYDDAVTRLRLKQGFGRLVRRADDRGVFVLLDPMTPTRLLGAFPEGVSVERVGLAEAVAATRAFLEPKTGVADSLKEDGEQP